MTFGHGQASHPPIDGAAGGEEDQTADAMLDAALEQPDGGDQVGLDVADRMLGGRFGDVRPGQMVDGVNFVEQVARGQEVYQLTPAPFDARRIHKPGWQRLPVADDDPLAQAAEEGDQMAADEAAAAGDEDALGGGHGWAAQVAGMRAHA